MVSPTGGAARANIPLNRCTNQIDTNPRRQKPANQPMAEFLIEIGRQQKSLSQGIEIVLDESEEQMVGIASVLGDIVQVGATKLSKKEKFVNAISCTKQIKCYPIYELVSQERNNTLKFTLDPRVVNEVDVSIPPRIHHTEGEVHNGMLAALWGGYCHAHPCQEDPLGVYEDLREGCMRATLAAPIVVRDCKIFCASGCL
ncbi:MAG: hypothetical protein ACRC7P_01540 [Enterovibrio sp.]